MTRPVLIAALTAGLLAAVLVAGERPGLGIALVAAALAVTGALGGGGDRWSRLWAALALALAAAPVLRDATWVVLPSLAVALALGSLAVAGGASWAGVAHGAAALLARTPFGPALVARAARAAAPRDGTGRVGPAVRGAVLAAGLVTVFGLLFASADEAFAQLAEQALPDGGDLGSLPGRLLAFIAAIALAGGLVLARGAGAGRELPAATRRLGGAEWLVGLVALDALFAAFVGVQITVLFGRADHVLETAGLTYAEYARQGFGQLLLVAALALVVVGAAMRWSPPGRRLAVRCALGLLLALTFVVLASAWHRLGLYQDVFGATRLRFAAGWAIVVVGVLLALVLGALAANRFAALPRASVAVAATALLALVALNPDRRIAERNLDRGGADLDYLESLSADAVPVLPPQARGRQDVRLTAEPDGLGGFNLARSRAAALLVP